MKLRQFAVNNYKITEFVDWNGNMGDLGVGRDPASYLK
jgi:hypothetical protein